MNQINNGPQIPTASGGTYVLPEDRFEVLTAEPDIRFLTQAVQPPSGAYIAPGDFLQVGVASSQASETLTVTWRVLMPNRKIAYNQFVMPVTADRSINIHREQLPEGFLLSVSCKASAATSRGQTFARIFITNPATGNGQPSFMLMADYITNAMAPAFPNGRQLAPSEGPGWIRFIQFGPFTAGGDFTINVPTNARWSLLVARGTLVTDPTAINRRADFGLLTAGAIATWLAGPIATQAASLTNRYNACQLVATASVDPAVNGWTLPPGATLLGGFQIVSSTFALQAADQWTSADVTVEEWIDNV